MWWWVLHRIPVETGVSLLTIGHSNTQADRHIKRRRSIVLGLVPGGYSTLVWIGVCLWEFWSATHACTNLKKNWPIHVPKIQIFCGNLPPFWLKFRKILKSRPIKVPNLRQPDLHQLYGNYFHYYHEFTVTHYMAARVGWLRGVFNFLRVGMFGA